MNYTVNEQGKPMKFVSNYVIGEDGGFVNGRSGYINPKIIEILNENIEDVNIKRIYCLCHHLDVLERKISLKEVCKLAGVVYSESPFDEKNNSGTKEVEKSLIELKGRGFIKVKGEQENKKLSYQDMRKLHHEKLIMARGNRIAQDTEFYIVRANELLERYKKAEVKSKVDDEVKNQVE